MENNFNLEIWHGNFNRFLVLCSLKNNTELSRAIIKKLTREHRTDGLIIITPGNIISMKFFDTQGIIDNCGNALRVTAVYCKNNGLCDNTGIIESFGMLFPFKIKNNKASVSFNNIKRENDLWIVGKVKHKVLCINSFEKTKNLALKILKKRKCNVTLIKKNKDMVFARTFETGLERFTDACGTGAIAAALETGNKKIFMPGGLLTISKTKNSIFLSGDVEKEGNI